MARYPEWKDGKFERHLMFEVTREDVIKAICHFRKENGKDFPLGVEPLINFMTSKLFKQGYGYFSLAVHTTYKPETIETASARFDKLFPRYEKKAS